MIGSENAQTQTFVPWKECSLPFFPMSSMCSSKWRIRMVANAADMFAWARNPLAIICAEQRKGGSSLQSQRMLVQTVKYQHSGERNNGFVHISADWSPVLPRAPNPTERTCGGHTCNTWFPWMRSTMNCSNINIYKKAYYSIRLKWNCVHLEPNTHQQQNNIQLAIAGEDNASKHSHSGDIL